MSSITYPIDTETPILVCDGLRTNVVDSNQVNYNRVFNETIACIIETSGSGSANVPTLSLRFFNYGNYVMVQIPEQQCTGTINSVKIVLPAAYFPVNRSELLAHYRFAGDTFTPVMLWIIGGNPQTGDNNKIVFNAVSQASPIIPTLNLWYRIRN
jgi:hypothetical protein